jgi:hypothetical protein
MVGSCVSGRDTAHPHALALSYSMAGEVRCSRSLWFCSVGLRAYGHAPLPSWWCGCSVAVVVVVVVVRPGVAGIIMRA